MAYLILALLSFAAMGVLHKLGDRMGGHPARITAVLFAVGLIGAAIRAAAGPGPAGTGAGARAIALAAPFGIASAAAVWSFQAGVRHGRIATSWLILNLSVALPTGLSILLYREPVGARKGVALLLIAASMALMWRDRRRGSAAPSASEVGATVTVGEG